MPSLLAPCSRQHQAEPQVLRALQELRRYGVTPLLLLLHASCDTYVGNQDLAKFLTTHRAPHPHTLLALETAREKD